MNFKEISEKPTKHEIEFLFELLLIKKYGISHEKMPTYLEHENFVKNHPYYKWYLIFDSEKAIGSLYINKDNSVNFQLFEDDLSIGIKVLELFYKSFKPQKELKSSRSKYFFFNINPNNKFMKSLLEKTGHDISQISYVKN